MEHDNEVDCTSSISIQSLQKKPSVFSKVFSTKYIHDNYNAVNIFFTIIVTDLKIIIDLITKTDHSGRAV
jgi:hypothetical protein